MPYPYPPSRQYPPLRQPPLSPALAAIRARPRYQAPRLPRSAGPTEEYYKHRERPDPPLGLSQLYARPSLSPSQITGWEPGPLQLDPIRRVTEVQEPDYEEQLERERQRLQMRGEVEEEFAGPPREQARRDRLRREFIGEQREADEFALEARQREETQRKESLRRGSDARELHALLVDKGYPSQEASVQATNAVNAGKAGDIIKRLRSEMAGRLKTDAEARGGMLEAEEVRGGREAVAGIVPEPLRPAALAGVAAPTLLTEAERLRKAAAPQVSPEEATYRREIAKIAVKQGIPPGAALDFFKLTPADQMNLLETRPEYRALLGEAGREGR